MSPCATSASSSPVSAALIRTYWRSAQWKLEDAGNGRLWIRNRASGKVLDLHEAPSRDGEWDGAFVYEKDRQQTDRDQRWLLVES
ncbi:RICIN domain-containing protein [Actinoplanes sp. NPDC051346]|uniref:RICIN domain-containing protein n=1 Tax=Actinoplanes sp. NPDC051346 TaxID=3155048 RepID=UPI00342573B9